VTAPIAVYDTMLFFQAAAQPDRIRGTMLAVKEGRIQLCLSKDLVAEISDVLTRPEYQLKFPALKPPAVDIFIADVVSRGKLFDPIPQTFTWPPHPDDDHIFNLAIVANADYLVTWETRILNLSTATTDDAARFKSLVPRLQIITPRDLAQRLKTQ